MKVYPKYKSSGVELLGEIPSDWVARRLASFGRFSKGSGISKADLIEEGIPTILYGDIYTKYNLKAENIFNFISQELASNSKLIDKGDLLFTGSGETREDIGKCVTYNGDIKVYAGGDIIIFSPKTNNHLFLAYSLSSNYAITVKAMNSRGDIIVHIYASSLRNIYLPIPSLAEQQQIVNFLDYKTGECDRFISNRQKQIELLNEQKAAIINKAVTKGINPNAKMKPSGIEWIGDIPEHWELWKLKNLLQAKLKYGANEAAEIDDPNLPRYIRITDFDDDGRLRDDTFKSLPFDVAKEYFLKDGDILFARSGATVGKTMIFENYFGNACFAGYLIMARCNPNKILSRFLYYYTKTPSYENWKTMIFIENTIQNIGADKYSLLPIAVPSVEDQQSIIDFIKKETSKVETLISKYQKQIELMQEYRTALISQAVTGKIDVRDWKPPTK
ncbi:restriction endonuclease subunit S [Microcoleus sp. B4-C1]|uniref:restriction endonuclease subunit S n=1 Tax=Microcoleus sp. B4-C1 TaxID=2818660 RepID=UPI002FD72AAE